MGIQQKTEISLKLTANAVYIPLAVSFAENTGAAFGFGDTENFNLKLSVEEIFCYLCRVLDGSDPVEIQARNGVYRLILRFLFKTSSLNLRVLNLTSKAPLEKGEEIDSLGLFVVARMVDRMKLSIESDGRTCLSVEIGRIYEESEPSRTMAVPGAESWIIRPADAEETQCLTNLVKAFCPQSHVPACLNHPGKAADMVAAGDLETALAVTPSGSVCGAVLWSWMSDKMVEMTGPFRFPSTQPCAMEEDLVNYVVESAAKTPAIGIFCRRESDQVMPAGFEQLGRSLGGTGKDGVKGPAFGIRLLREDEGTAVYCHPLLESFLRQEYDRLVLARTLRIIPFQGSGAAAHSVFTCETNKERQLVVLSGLSYGQDAPENLREHLELFAGKNIETVLFELDLGVSWQGAFVPALLASGFAPQMVLPYAGRSDTVIFQLV